MSALHVLHMSLAMLWEILWALILGFLLSGVVQAVVSKREMSRLLPDDSTRSLALAAALGAASSSCSYAAVALARSIFRKGANFTASLVFAIASTNLVIELGIILVLLMGWRFAAAEFLGAPIMIAVVALLCRLYLTPDHVAEAKRQADKGIPGSMEGHAGMDMAVTEGPLFRRIFSEEGKTAIAHYFVMDWVSLWKDIAAGLLLAGAIAVWVPHDFWTAFFLTSHPALARVWGPVIGPVVSMASFVCSVGNVPLAAVLWNNGISFGGVVAFIYADLIVLPILDIYRRYYGWKMMAFIATAFYASMVAGSLAIEFLFELFGWIPHERKARVLEAGIQFDYTTVLNLIFLMIAALLLVRFFKTGGPEMLRAMESPGVSGNPDAIYACPMHPEVNQKGPGSCSRCGMPLVARSQKPGNRR
jgi:uncharacterized membrane protein YraQ (UPF0718 family)